MAVKTRVNARSGKTQELVEVIVNGKNGQFVSHRWRNVKAPTTGSNDPFNSTKKKIQGVTVEAAEELLRVFAANMVRLFARATPVDTGRATANWLVGLNKEPRSDSNIFDKTASANKTFKAAQDVLKNLDLNDQVIIKNSVSSDGESDYIIKLELGHSPKAPTGMFRKNVVKAKQVLKKSKKKIGL